MVERTHRRGLRRLLFAALALPLVIVGGTELALATPLGLWLLNKAFAGDVAFDYQSAWSIWPGRVHVRGLVLQGEDSNVQWVLRTERTEATIALGELFHRTFHATRARSSGVSFAARLKMPRGEATPERLAGLPALPGFAPPIKAEGPSEDDTDERYRLWTIHLDDVAAELRESWVEQLHLSGSALVTGGFFLKPVRRAQVEGQLLAGPLELRIGDELVATGLHGHLALSLHPFDPREVHGRDVLGQVTLQAKLEGMLAGLGLLQRQLSQGLQLEGAPGPLSIALQLERGKLVAGTSIEARSPRFSLQLGRVRAEGEGAFALDVTAAEARAALVLTELAVAPLRAFPLPARVRRARLEVRSDALDLTGAPSFRTFTADLDGGELPDLQLLEALLPPGSGVRIEGGQASLHAHLAGTPEVASGRIAFAAHEATGSLSRDRVRVSLHGEADFHVHPLRTVDLAGMLAIDHVNLLHASNAPDWWGHFQIPRAHLDPSARSLALELKGECRDARPLGGLFAAQGVPGFVAGIFSMQGVHVRGALRMAPGELSLLDLRATGEGAQIRANYRSRDGVRRGAALFSAHGLAAGLDLDGGRASVVMLNPTAWYALRLQDKRLLAASEAQE